VEHGPFRIAVGGASPGARATALGVSESLLTTLTVR